MLKSLTISTLEELPSVAKKIVALVNKQKVVAFYGSMGAGKTTLIKAICEELGVRDNISSPTFSIVNEYKAADGRNVYHFDFYRINKESEAFDMGYEDYFYSDALCLIEWPEKIESLLPADHLKIKIAVNDNKRVIDF